MLILTYCHDLFCYFYVARGKIFIENIMKLYGLQYMKQGKYIQVSL